ncbi:MAG: TetR/AcrR family transcriptional regulator [Trueperaceae bacterium]
MTPARRADPLPPDARREAIAAAVAPVLIERGAAVTTKELAQAAGVAEGTLFTVFPDKRAIVLAAVERRMDPEPVVRGMRGIASDAPLDEQLRRAATLVLAGMQEAFALFAVLHAVTAPESSRRRRPGHVPEAPAFVTRWSTSVIAALEELLEPHRARLRTAPSRVATVLLGMLFACNRPYATAPEPMNTTEIVDVVLHGVLEAAAGKEATPGSASEAKPT